MGDERVDVTIVDCGIGNVKSVLRMLEHVDATAEIVSDPADATNCKRLVLPGVGAFDDCICAMRKQELLEAVKQFIASGRPFLGICVGYQALFERSDEFNSCAQGLTLFKGRVVRFPDRPGLKVPQIGWNQLEIVQPACPIFRGITNGSYVYFVHSFFPRPEDPSIVATRTSYGETFASSIWKENVFATQFHPEKSQDVGLQLLENFVRL